MALGRIRRDMICPRCGVVNAPDRQSYGGRSGSLVRPPARDDRPLPPVVPITERAKLKVGGPPNLSRRRQRRQSHLLPPPRRLRAFRRRRRLATVRCGRRSHHPGCQPSPPPPIFICCRRIVRPASRRRPTGRSEPAASGWPQTGPAVWPSACRAPEPPLFLAVAGLTTPSMAAPIKGSSKRKASISHEISTSSGSLVRLLGTIAMSSNPYARRPDLPLPISISTIPTSRTRLRSGLVRLLRRSTGQKALLFRPLWEPVYWARVGRRDNTGPRPGNSR